MSDTAHVTHHLSEYLDNALSAHEKHTVEKHLEQCRECTGRYRELQHLRQRLKHMPELTPPESFYQGVLQKIEEDKKSFLIWDWPMATKAVATFGVLMVVVMVAREARRSEPELFAPVSQTAAPEAEPAAPSPVPSSLANTAPVPAPVVVHAELQALNKKADIVEPVALKQKVARKAIVASNVISADEEREKDVDQLTSATEMRANLGTTDKALALAGTGGSLAAPMAAAPMDMTAGKVTLQARDINGPATQGSFMAGQQQAVAKEEASAALSYAASNAAPGQIAEWKGASSAISSFRTVVITNQTDWNVLWAEHAPDSNSPAPLVDFNHFLVIGVFAGTNQALQGIAIQNVQATSDSITVFYKEEPLDPAIRPAAPTNRPYHLKQIPKSSLPITFIKRP